MIIESQELPPIGTNAFALIEPSRKECVIVDAPAEAYDWAMQVAQQHGCQIVALILTHGHWDHILDGHKFAAAGIPTYGHLADTEMFAAPSKMASYAIPGLDLLPVPIDHWIKAGDTLDLLGDQLEIRHVPGHCPGNILVYVASAQAAIVGDVIFAEASGVTIYRAATSQCSSNRSKHRFIRCRMRRLSILGMAQIPRSPKKKAVIHLCAHEFSRPVAPSLYGACA